MSLIKQGLVARAQALHCLPSGASTSFDPYALVLVKKDVVVTGGQAFHEGHIAIAAPDRLELRGEPHRLVFCAARESHVAVPVKDLAFLEPPKS